MEKPKPLDANDAEFGMSDHRECRNPECEDGQVPDPNACWKPCPECNPTAK